MSYAGPAGGLGEERRSGPRHARPRTVCWLLLVWCVALCGCSTVVAGSPKAARFGAGPSGPINPAELDQLLTPSHSLSVVSGQPLSEDDMHSALFAGSDPAECQGVVAYGGYALLPKTYTGREARTQNDGYSNQHQLLEVSATYPAGFDAAGFLDSVRKTVSGCQHPVTAWGNDKQKVTVNPAPLAQGSPEVVQWSTNLTGHQWVCDFAIISKANVIAEIVTCSADHSVDIQALINKRIRKIDELINYAA